MRDAPRPGWDGPRQLAWDATSLDSYLACPRYHHFAIRLGRRLPGGKADLIFGTCLHHGVGTYAIARRDGATAEEALLQGVQAALAGAGDLPPQSATGATKSRMGLIRALVEWDASGAWRGITEVEHAWSSPSPTADHTLCGHIDAARDGEPLEWKTTTSGHGMAIHRRHEMSVQVAMYKRYTQAARLHLGAFAMLVGSATYKEYIYFREGWSEEEFDALLVHTLERADATAEEVAAGRVPLGNPAACERFGGCPYRRVCSHAPSVRDAILASDYVLARWEPLTATVTVKEGGDVLGK